MTTGYAMPMQDGVRLLLARHTNILHSKNDTTFSKTTVSMLCFGYKVPAGNWSVVKVLDLAGVPRINTMLTKYIVWQIILMLYLNILK